MSGSNKYLLKKKKNWKLRKLRQSCITRQEGSTVIWELQVRSSCKRFILNNFDYFSCRQRIGIGIVPPLKKIANIFFFSQFFFYQFRNSKTIFSLIFTHLFPLNFSNDFHNFIPWHFSIEFFDCFSLFFSFELSN